MKWHSIIALVVVALLGASAGAHAQGTVINSSCNGCGGAWSDAAQWTPNGVPNTLNMPANTYNVTIDDNAAPTVDENVEINSLSVGTTAGSGAGLLDTNGFTLTVDQNATNYGFLILSGGSNLVVKGNLTNAGVIPFEYNSDGVLTPSTMTVDGTLTNTGNLQTNALGDGAPNTLTVGTLVSAGGNGTANIDGFGIMVQVNSGTTLNVTKELDITSGEVQVFGTVNGLSNINQFTGGELYLVGQNDTITPAFNSGTLNVGGTLLLDGSSLSINGNVTNFGSIQTQNQLSGSPNSFNVSGTLTNGGQFLLGDAGDSATLGQLANTGTFITVPGTTVTLTNQPNGITDIPSGSSMQISGTFNAGSNSPFANLQSIEGNLALQNGQSFTDTPASGTLTIGSKSLVTENAAWTVDGNVGNKGFFVAGGPFTVAGTLDNEAGATFYVNNTATVGTLANAGTLQVGYGATLNVGNQVTIAAGSELDLLGTIKSGGQNGLTGLDTIAGALGISNGQSLTITPPSGTLNQAGALYIGGSTKVTVQGNLDNTGSARDSLGFPGLDVEGVLTVTGDLNNSAAMTVGGTLNAASLENSGSIDDGSTSGMTINIAGTFTQNGQVSLINNDDLINASTMNFGTSNSIIPELSANTVNVSSTATLDSFLANIGGTPITPGTTAPSNPLVTIASNGTLIVNGTATFGLPPTQTNNFPGAPGTVNTAGTVTIGAGGTLDTAGGSYNQSAGSTTINGTLKANLTLSGGKLSGGGTIAGSLIDVSGIVQPSDPLSVIGNYTNDSAGTFLEDISSSTNFGGLDVSGTADLAGTLDIALLDNFLPANGEQFVILDAVGGLNGTFSTIEGLDFGPGNSDSWSLGYSSNEVMLTANVNASPAPEPSSLVLLGTVLMAFAWLLRKKPGLGVGGWGLGVGGWGLGDRV